MGAEEDTDELESETIGNFVYQTNQPINPVLQMTALAEQNGKLKALHHVNSWIDYHLARENNHAAYIAALIDLKINVQAAIQRTLDGEPIESTSEFTTAV